MRDWKELRQCERTPLLIKWEQEFTNRKDSEIKRMTFHPQDRILFNWANPKNKINIYGKKSNIVHVFSKKKGARKWMY